MDNWYRQVLAGLSICVRTFAPTIEYNLCGAAIGYFNINKNLIVVANICRVNHYGDFRYCSCLFQQVTMRPATLRQRAMTCSTYSVERPDKTSISPKSSTFLKKRSKIDAPLWRCCRHLYVVADYSVSHCNGVCMYVMLIVRL